MKKITTWLVLITFSTVPFSSSLLADSPGQATEVPEKTEEQSQQDAQILESQPPGEVQSVDVESSDESYDEPQGTPVSPASNSAKNSRKKELIRNCLIAAGAVVIAVVSMLVVSNNNGSHK